jgi:hypothetical protein
MSTTTISREQPSTMMTATHPTRSSAQAAVTIVGSPTDVRIGALAALAEVVVIEPTETGDIGELFDLWDEEDRQGDPEEQQRSLDLLMRRLDEDRS